MQLGRMQKDSRISNDEQHTLQHDVQAETDKYVAELDDMLQQKLKEVVTP